MLCDFCLVSLSRDTCRWNSPLCYEQARVTQRPHVGVLPCSLNQVLSQQPGSTGRPVNEDVFRRFPSLNTGAGMSHSHTQKPWEIRRDVRKDHCCLRSSLFGEPEMEKHLTYPWEMCSDFRKHSVDLLLRSKDKRESTPVGFLFPNKGSCCSADHSSLSWLQVLENLTKSILAHKDLLLHVSDGSKCGSGFRNGWIKEMEQPHRDPACLLFSMTLRLSHFFTLRCQMVIRWHQ